MYCLIHSCTYESVHTKSVFHSVYAIWSQSFSAFSFLDNEMNALVYSHVVCAFGCQEAGWEGGRWERTGGFWHERVHVSCGYAGAVASFPPCLQLVPPPHPTPRLPPEDGTGLFNYIVADSVAMMIGYTRIYLPIAPPTLPSCCNPMHCLPPLSFLSPPFNSATVLSYPSCFLIVSLSPENSATVSTYSPPLPPHTLPGCLLSLATTQATPKQATNVPAVNTHPNSHSVRKIPARLPQSVDDAYMAIQGTRVGLACGHVREIAPRPHVSVVQSLVVIVFRMHLVVAVLHMNANAFWLISVYKYPLGVCVCV